MVVHRQSEPYRLHFARVLGALKWRALIHRCTCPKSPKYVGLENAEELLNRFEEYWQGYTLVYEPRHWYVSDRGMLASGSTSIKNTIWRQLSVGGHHQQLLADKPPLGYR